jgi:hypothetical protein
MQITSKNHEIWQILLAHLLARLLTILGPVQPLTMALILPVASAKKS